MDVIAFVLAHAGIAHRRDLAAAGFTSYRIGIAIRSGTLVPLGRMWIATASVDPALALAASIGGRIACTTAARHLGLWTLTHDTPHVAVPPTSKVPRLDGVRLHRSIPLAPVRRTSIVESIVDVLAHVAVCLPREEALVIWESALRLGRILPSSVAHIPWRSIAAQTLANACDVLSDSGLETMVVDRLRALGLPVRQQVALLGHNVDILIGSRLVVQIDGWEHHSSAKDRARDNRHDARLRAAGYRVIRIGYAEVVHGWAAIELEIVTAVAQLAHSGVHPRATSGWVGR